MDLPFLQMTTESRLGRIIGLLALAAVLAGCSAVKLGYNNRAAAEQADAAVIALAAGLTPEQFVHLERELAARK
jgi:hypothetical protein